jgi:uncharacterized protein
VKVAFTDISKAGNRYSINDDTWFPETEFRRIAPVSAELALNRKGDSRVEVQGFLSSKVQLVCDRCLGGYDFAVDVKFHLVLEVATEESWQIKDLECSSTDLDIIQLVEPEVDFGDILRQQLYLSLPDKRICSEDCKGLCSQCGGDLNKADCGCTKEIKISPFAVLAALKK